VIGLAIGAVTWIDSYQPLTLGNGAQYPDGAVDDPAGGMVAIFTRGDRSSSGSQSLTPAGSECAFLVCLSSPSSRHS
jgi:hypothetical protein